MKRFVKLMKLKSMFGDKILYFQNFETWNVKFNFYGK